MPRPNNHSKGLGQLADPVLHFGFVQDADYTVVIPSSLAFHSAKEAKIRARLLPNERRFPPENPARLREQLTTVHISPHGDAADFHAEFKRLVGVICGFPGRVRLLIGSTDRWWPKHYSRDAVDQLYDAARCPSIVSVRAQNLHAAFLRPQQAKRTGLLPIGLPPLSNWTKLPLSRASPIWPAGAAQPAEWPRWAGAWGCLAYASGGAERSPAGRRLSRRVFRHRKLQQIAAAAPPLRQRNVSMLAADWALPGGKSYPKRPIGYRTRAELRVALQASGCVEDKPDTAWVPARPNRPLWPSLPGAWGSLRHALAVRAASREASLPKAVPPCSRSRPAGCWRRPSRGGGLRSACGGCSRSTPW